MGDTKTRWPEFADDVRQLFLDNLEWVSQVRIDGERPEEPVKPLPESTHGQIAAALTLGVLLRAIGLPLSREIADSLLRSAR
jgi:hypothetical protein